MTPHDATISTAERIDAVCDQFEADWQAGLRPRIEDYLGKALESEYDMMRSALLAVQSELAKDYDSNAETIDVKREKTTGETVEIGGYEIRGEIARGGMGRVLSGIELALEREVAIKVLLPKANARRFISESKITARLPHPGIPPVYTHGRLSDGSPFIAMKLVRGKTLAQELKDTPGSPSNLTRYLQIFEQICLAVGFAHSQGIIHRDLKPSNVMIGAYGEVLVMDWGLAKDTRSNDIGSDQFPPQPIGREEQTLAGEVMGTPSYMAPEQARGEQVDARADVFALGAILFNIATGKLVFTGDSVYDTIRNAASCVFSDAVGRLSDHNLDPELTTIIRTCLAPDAAGRPADGSKVASLVSSYCQGVEDRLRKAESERNIAEARIQEQQKRRRLFVRATGIVATIVLFGMSAVIYFGWKSLQETKRAANETQKRLMAELSRQQTEQLRLLDNYRSAQRLARDSGNSREVIAIVDRVRESGLELPSEMELEAISALFDLGDLSTFDRRMTAFRATEIPVNLRARARLLDGQREIGRNDTLATTSLDEAIKLGLSDALKLLALGLIQEDPLPAIEYFQKSIQLDPRAIKPRIYLAYGQIMLGRYNESLAQADQLEVLSPDHLQVTMIRLMTLSRQMWNERTIALHAKLKGHIPEELHGLMKQFLPVMSLTRRLTLEAFGGPSVPELTQILLDLSLNGNISIAQKLKTPGSDAQDLMGLSLDTPLAFRKYSTLVRTFATPNSLYKNLDDPKIESFGAEIRRFPEGTLLWMYAMSLYYAAGEHGKIDAKSRAMYLKAGKLSLEALRLPSLFEIDDIALDTALICYSMGSISRGLPIDLEAVNQVKPWIQKRLTMKLDRPTVPMFDQTTALVMASMARELNDPPLIRQCIDFWDFHLKRLKLKPDSRFFAIKAKGEFLAHSYTTALEAAIESDKLEPREDMKEIIAKCKEKLR